MTIRLSRILTGGGALLVLLGLVLGGAGGSRAARAQDLPPRPTEVPTATAAPTATTSAPRSAAGSEAPADFSAGRITGTVIDQSTGAPAPGVAVTVGDATVTTDASGNYSRAALPAGSYPVALALAGGQGLPAQGTVVVGLAADTTVVQHLFFRSRLVVAAAPAAAAPVVPAALPETGGPAADGSLWLLLGLGMIGLGGGVRARGRRG